MYILYILLNREVYSGIENIVLRQEVKGFLSLHMNKKARGRTGGGAKIWI